MMVNSYEVAESIAVVARNQQKPSGLEVATA
jgi:hypothetical protein